MTKNYEQMAKNCQRLETELKRILDEKKKLAKELKKTQQITSKYERQIMNLKKKIQESGQNFCDKCEIPFSDKWNFRFVFYSFSYIFIVYIFNVIY